MKKLCVIILPVFLSMVLSSCAWIYQVTGVEGIENTEETTRQQSPEGKTAGKVDTQTDTDSLDTIVLQEGCYSNGTYIMELTDMDGVAGNGYHIVIYTPQYGIRMFIGSIRENDSGADTFTVVDNDDPRVCITIIPSEDGQVLSTSFLVDEEKILSISGEYAYFDPQSDETEKVSSDVVISEGEYTYKEYRMTITYEAEFIRVCIESQFGETLFKEIKSTKVPLCSVMFEGEWGNTILVPARDGSGDIVVAGRSASDRTLQYAGTYTLS